jgi:hypothetical protein
MAIMMPPQQQGSPIERLLGLVNAGFGIASHIRSSKDDALKRKFLEEEHAAKAAEQGRKERGEFLPGEILPHLDNFDRVAPTDSGAFPVKVKRGDIMEDWGLKPRAKTNALADMVSMMTLKQKQAELDNGKRLPADKVLSVNEGNTLPTMLGDVKGMLEKNAPLFGPLSGRMAGLNPYNEQAQTADAQLRTAAQSFGKYMEGGVLRKEDEEKYRKMFPQLSDTPEVARNKMALVERMLAQKQNSNVQALADQGYSTSGLNKPLAAPPVPGTLTRGSAGNGGSLIPDAAAAKPAPTREDLEALDWLKANPNDPHAPGVIKRLQAAGLL